MNILIADDNASIVKVLRAMLEEAGHEVQAATDGAEALGILEQQKVDAIISDILMPRMDGYRFCLEVRRRQEFNTTPFIFYTSTYTSASDEKTALDLGADKFLKKPAPVDDILATLKAAVAEAPRRQVRPVRTEQELGSMKEYNARLVSKLEVQNLELEAQTESLRQNQDELLESREQFRALTARLQEAREEERVRISREMHDGLGELLSGIAMGLAWLRTLLEPKPAGDNRAQLLEKIEEIERLVGSTGDRVRKLCTELRPAVLDDLGLVAAIEWQARDFQARTRIRCEAKLGVEMVAASREQATAIFRIFQEILTNVARHAEASKVRVRLAVDHANLVLEVKDNGKGIPPGEIAGPKALGLLGMKERAGLLGGKVAITGGPGKGTCVTVSIPIGQPKPIAV
jgi:signal transduction histidine kinase